MEVLNKILGLFAGIGLLVLFIYYFVLTQAPIKSKKDKKIILILTGVLIGPIVYFHANAVQIGILGAVWLILLGAAFSNRSLSKNTEKQLLATALIGYVIGMYVQS